MDTLPNTASLPSFSSGPVLQLLLLQILNHTNNTQFPVSTYENKVENYLDESREVDVESKLHSLFRIKRDDGQKTKHDAIRDLLLENLRLKTELREKEDTIAELQQSVNLHMPTFSGRENSIINTSKAVGTDDEILANVENTSVFSQTMYDLLKENHNTTAIVINLKEDALMTTANLSHIINSMIIIEQSLHLQSDLMQNLSLAMDSIWFKSFSNQSECVTPRYTRKRSLETVERKKLEKLQEELISAKKYNALLYSYYKFEDKLTGLLRACAKCDLGDVKLLVEHGASLSEKDDSGNTCIHLAAKEGCESVVEWIIKNSTFNDFPNTMGATPLHVCAKFNQYKVAKLLINNNAPIDSMTKDFRTPLYFAAQYGHLQIMRLLLDSGANIKSLSPSHGTPLHAAALHSNLHILRALLDSGAQVNSVCRLGAPLHFAIQGGDLSVVQVLLNYGATVDTMTESKMSPLHLAAEYDRESISQLLIEKGANVNARMEDMSTPLHVSARNGSLSVAELLLDSGAEVDAKTANGLTPLYIAAENGHALVGRLLLDKGARLAALPHARFSEFLVDVLYGRGVLDLTDENKERLLVVAAREGNLTLSRLLIEVGTFVSPRYEYGFTPLHWAATKGYIDVAKALLEAGADLEKVDLHFFTPLNRAAWNGRLEVCKMLIEKGADVSSRTIKNHTPLHGAAMQGHLEVVQLLVENGADIQATNAYGRTPLEEAVINKKHNVSAWLSQQSLHHGTTARTTDFEDHGTTARNTDFEDTLHRFLYAHV